MQILEFLAIPIAYLLGAFPSAYIIGKFWGRVDITKEGDGHVSATAVYRRSGLIPFITAIILDVGKGALAVIVASIITDNVYIIMAAGIAAVIGHCWSVYIRFRGGLGATAIYGVLAGFLFWQFLIGFAIGVIIFFTTRKSTVSTVIVIVITSIVLFITVESITGKSLLLILYPLIFIVIQLLKRFQIKSSGIESAYKHELSDDLKRMR